MVEEWPMVRFLPTVRYSGLSALESTRVSVIYHGQWRFEPVCVTVHIANLTEQLVVCFPHPFDLTSETTLEGVIRGILILIRREGKETRVEVTAGGRTDVMPVHDDNLDRFLDTAQPSLLA